MSNKRELRIMMANVVAKISSENKRIQSKNVFDKIVAHSKYKQAKSISLYLSTANEINTIPLLKQALEVDKKQCFIPYVSTRKLIGTELKEQKEEQQRQGEALVHSKATGLPRMQMIELKSMDQFNALPLNHYGIREPAKNSEIVREQQDLIQFMDLIIVPGVAFARDGRRLGHGKGYYDEFLTYLKANNNGQPFYTIGVAFEEQIIENPLAVSGQDYSLNEIISGRA